MKQARTSPDRTILAPPLAPSEIPPKIPAKSPAKTATKIPARTTRTGPAVPPRRASRWRWRMLVVAPLLAWGGAASWYAYDSVQTVARVQAEQTAQKKLYEDKVRALTRRLVGVASHQMLEQDGLAGRMADIVTRQVELENRLAILSGYADRLADGPGPRAQDPVLAPATAPAMAPTRGRAEGGRDLQAPAEAGGTRIGRRPGDPPAAPAPGSRSALDDAARERMSALDALTTREQFDALDGALDRVARTQTAVLAAFARAAQDGVGRIRAMVAGLGLTAGCRRRPRAGRPPRRATPSRTGHGWSRPGSTTCTCGAAPPRACRCASRWSGSRAP